MKIYSIASIWIFLVIGCTGNKPKVSAENLLEILVSDSVISNIYHFKRNETLFNKMSFVDSYNGNIVYLLDASCSLCIAKFFDFCQIAHAKGNSAPIFVIVDEGMSIMLNYYLNQSRNQFSFPIILYENTKEEYVKLHIGNNDLSGVIILYDEDCAFKKAYRYEY